MLRSSSRRALADRGTRPLAGGSAGALGGKTAKGGSEWKGGRESFWGRILFARFLSPPFVAFLARRSTELSFERRWHGLAGWFVLTAPLCLPRKMGRWGRAVWAPTRPQWGTTRRAAARRPAFPSARTPRPLVPLPRRTFTTFGWRQPPSIQSKSRHPPHS